MVLANEIDKERRKRLHFCVTIVELFEITVPRTFAEKEHNAAMFSCFTNLQKNLRRHAIRAFHTQHLSFSSRQKID